MRRPKARIPVAGASLGRRRVSAGVGALLAALVVALLPLSQGADAARAAAADSAVTGSAVTGSAVTKKGTKGVHDDFSALEVTVHQTKGLTGQAVRVTWKGGTPRTGTEGRNFLSLMQCWGDDAAGPDRTQCEYGFTPGAQAGGNRTVAVKPAGSADPLEEETGTPTDRNGTHYVPFRPVAGQGDATTSPSDATYFTAGDTNGIPFLPHDGNGGGDVAFEVKSSLEQPALGCGARLTPSGAVQPCWLVVVPRGAHEPNGSGGNSGNLTSSSLSRSNWEQRIAFRLDFQPVEDGCDADKPEREIVGSELATDAVTSWQSELCRTGTHRFTFSQNSEQAAREAATSPADSSSGLGLTLEPAQAPEGSPPVVHAPVAVSGLTIGFVWMYPKPTGQGAERADVPVRELRLNQRLLAKVLTQSYADSLVPTRESVPDRIAGNPRAIGQDPEFQKLNPGLDGLDAESNSPIGLAVSSANSDATRLVWKYILANRDAREFIQGKTDPWGMKVNPEYKKEGVISDSLDYYPKADLTPTELACTETVELSRTGQDMVPYANDMHAAAVNIRRGDIGSAFMCVQGDNNIWKLGGGSRPTVTQQRQYGIVDAPSAVRYQLKAAALADADGDFVEPTNASLLEAVAQMPDSPVAGVKAPDPGRAKDGAYPLTTVVYAAASVELADDARKDYARAIRYAAGAGQTQGTDKGQLPHGYAPLPTAMREQAVRAADQLEKGAPESTGPTSPQDTPGSGGTSGGGDAGATAGGTGGDTSGAAAGGSTDPAADPDASDTSRPSAAPSDLTKQNIASSGGLTPSDVLGLVRWVLLGVLIAGGVAGLAGPVMLRLSARGATPGGPPE
ncbi:hypothetical protein JIX56_16095 [Streptomyces sp. CA-210063]|uniref:hypothetical protein n=1 Tax=Streptomyces sp. CA-210063 TaxID=2801029 RepID=UPI00214CCC4A|nr:hypothetical protein [Streptomyces sp. CA-210063]UUU31300.1 hypothetical protein JIX56_16095 [Streptomyces sp. CA-210063]